MKEQKKTFLNNTHFVILIPVLVCILALAIALFIKPAEVSTAIEAFKSNALNALTPFYLWLGLGVVAFCVFIAFSKYGNVRLGAEKPEFGLFPWIAMMFCAGMGSSLMYWAAAEWISYLSAPPMGAEPFSQQAQELAMVYGSYHWGITPWALYIVGAIALGIRYYIHKKPELSLSACCAAVIGEKRVNTLTGRIIDIIFILGLLAGQACTLYFGTPMICEILHRLFGIERSFGMTIVVMCVVTMIFMVTSWVGIGKGMKNVSTYTAYAAIAIAMTRDSVCHDSPPSMSAACRAKASDSAVRPTTRPRSSITYPYIRRARSSITSRSASVSASMPSTSMSAAHNAPWRTVSSSNAITMAEAPSSRHTDSVLRTSSTPNGNRISTYRSSDCVSEAQSTPTGLPSICRNSPSCRAMRSLDEASRPRQANIASACAGAPVSASAMAATCPSR